MSKSMTSMPVFENHSSQTQVSALLDFLFEICFEENVVAHAFNPSIQDL